MTATLFRCEKCEQKTKHIVGTLTHLDGRVMDSLRCTVCGSIVPVWIQPPPDEPAQPKELTQ